MTPDTLALEHWIDIHDQQELDIQNHAERRLTDIKTGIGDLALKPEGDPDNLDDYESLATPTPCNTCAHGYVTEQGERSGITYHDEGDGYWTLCDDDPDYETFAATHPHKLPLNPTSL